MKPYIEKTGGLKPFTLAKELKMKTKMKSQLLKIVVINQVISEKMHMINVT